MIDFEQLARNMEGEVMTDSLHQMIYATDVFNVWKMQKGMRSEIYVLSLFRLLFGIRQHHFKLSDNLYQEVLMFHVYNVMGLCAFIGYSSFCFCHLVGYS